MFCDEYGSFDKPPEKFKTRSLSHSPPYSIILPWCLKHRDLSFFNNLSKLSESPFHFTRIFYWNWGSGLRWEKFTQIVFTSLLLFLSGNNALKHTWHSVIHYGNAKLKTWNKRDVSTKREVNVGLWLIKSVLKQRTSRKNNLKLACCYSVAWEKKEKKVWIFPQ